MLAMMCKFETNLPRRSRDMTRSATWSANGNIEISPVFLYQLRELIENQLTQRIFHLPRGLSRPPIPSPYMVRSTSRNGVPQQRLGRSGSQTYSKPMPSTENSSYRDNVSKWGTLHYAKGHSAQSELLWRIYQCALWYLLMFLCNWGVRSNII